MRQMTQIREFFCLLIVSLRASNYSIKVCIINISAFHIAYLVFDWLKVGLGLLVADVLSHRKVVLLNHLPFSLHVGQLKVGVVLPEPLLD